MKNTSMLDILNELLDELRGSDRAKVEKLIKEVETKVSNRKERGVNDGRIDN